MTGTEAVALLMERFPALKEKVGDPNDLFEMPHVTYGLLATELVENSADEGLLDAASRFINDLANSGDSLLEELLVIDILEGLAQDPDLARRISGRINPKAAAFLERV